MPTYDYVCSHCEHEFEAFQSMKDDPLRKCPACGRLKLRRRLGTGAGLIFKGSGFYETDYKRNGRPAKEAAGESSTSTTSESGGSTKADAASSPPKSATQATAPSRAS